MIYEAALDQMVAEIAKADMGRGEFGRNNRGRDVQYFRDTAGLSTVFGGGEWCAIWISSVYRRAYYALNMPMAFRPSRGALRLGKNMAKAGTVLRRPEPVCVIITKRKGGHHAQLCLDLDFNEAARGLDGNKGKFPAYVAPWHLSFREWERARLIVKI